MSSDNSSFITVDFETANSHVGSVCAVGVVKVLDGTITDRWTTLINPETEFNQFNIDIHGITPDDVQDAPKFPEVHQALKDRLEGNTMVSHGAFDVAALDRATCDHALSNIQYDYINSQTVVRWTWSEF